MQPALAFPPSSFRRTGPAIKKAKPTIPAAVAAMPLGYVEVETARFRRKLAAEHIRKAALASRRKPCVPAVSYEVQRPDASHDCPEMVTMREVSRNERRRLRARLDKSRCRQCEGCATLDRRQIEGTIRWHKSRAKGQLERFQNARGCGGRTAMIHCTCCGVAQTFSLGCEVARLCEKCAFRGAKERRAKFGFARAQRVHDADLTQFTMKGRRMRALPFSTRKEHSELDADDAKAAGGWHTERGWLCGGQWTEKLLTLTVPHFREPDGIDSTVYARVRVAFAAWRSFSLQWSRFWREYRKQFRAPLERPWLHRSFEWTPGADGLGHPHFHVWALSGFMPQQLLRSMWRRALEDAGMTDPQPPSVHIKQVRGEAAEISRELFKAGKKAGLQFSRLMMGEAVKQYCEGWNIGPALKNTPPIVVARLYESLEGARLSQGSRGFYLQIESECPDCGSTVWRFEIEELPFSQASYTPALSTGPPTQGVHACA